MREYFKKIAIIKIVAMVILLIQCFAFIRILYNLRGELNNREYTSYPSLSGTVDDKSISRSTNFLGYEYSHYHVIIDDKAYTTKCEEWNKITEGDEVEYRENSSGEIIIE